MRESLRRPHAVLDLASRKLKARKIERLLTFPPDVGAIDLLEVGTGSGGIANYFGSHASRSFEVTSVDVVDSRIEVDGYRFVEVENTQLPFPDQSFDAVISNHVIEHVGDMAAQMHHLAELRRVLRPDGCGYLAVPNRWMLVEPHYRLAFLSWLPRSWRSPYLRIAKGVEFYDCEPLTQQQLETMLSASNFESENICVEAMRLTMEIEHPGSFVDRVLQHVPTVAIRPLRSMIPTLIYRFWKSDIEPVEK